MTKTTRTKVTQDYNCLIIGRQTASSLFLGWHSHWTSEHEKVEIQKLLSFLPWTAAHSGTLLPIDPPSNKEYRKTWNCNCVDLIWTWPWKSDDLSSSAKSALIKKNYEVCIFQCKKFSLSQIWFGSHISRDCHRPSKTVTTRHRSLETVTYQ